MLLHENWRMDCGDFSSEKDQDDALIDKGIQNENQFKEQDCELFVSEYDSAISQQQAASNVPSYARLKPESVMVRDLVRENLPFFLKKTLHMLDPGSQVNFPVRRRSVYSETSELWSDGRNETLTPIGIGHGSSTSKGPYTPQVLSNSSLIDYPPYSALLRESDISLGHAAAWKMVEAAAVRPFRMVKSKYETSDEPIYSIFFQPWESHRAAYPRSWSHSMDGSISGSRLGYVGRRSVIFIDDHFIENIYPIIIGAWELLKGDLIGRARPSHDMPRRSRGRESKHLPPHLPPHLVSLSETEYSKTHGSREVANVVTSFDSVEPTHWGREQRESWKAGAGRCKEWRLCVLSRGRSNASGNLRKFKPAPFTISQEMGQNVVFPDKIAELGRLGHWLGHKCRHVAKRKAAAKEIFGFQLRATAGRSRLGGLQRQSQRLDTMEELRDQVGFSPAALDIGALSPHKNSKSLSGVVLDDRKRLGQITTTLRHWKVYSVEHASGSNAYQAVVFSLNGQPKHIQRQLRRNTRKLASTAENFEHFKDRGFEILVFRPQEDSSDESVTFNADYDIDFPPLANVPAVLRNLHILRLSKPNLVTAAGTYASILKSSETATPKSSLATPEGHHIEKRHGPTKLGHRKTPDSLNRIDVGDSLENAAGDSSLLPTNPETATVDFPENRRKDPTEQSQRREERNEAQRKARSESQRLRRQRNRAQKSAKRLCMQEE